MADYFSSLEFESNYTYRGLDLGSNWSPDQTVFKLWAPTAEGAKVNLYRSGDPDAKDLIRKIPMIRSENGTWTAVQSANLNGVYYTYTVKIGDYIAEACDPYARTTGVNGHRGMVIDLTSTNPEGWDQDRDPHFGINPTDAVIYELHIRDLSVHRSSRIRNKGKFLGLAETGTTTTGGIPTGLNHIKNLGITHVQLLPVFDYGSVDEAHPEKKQFNWGYDPVNFNTPEGSYATDARHGEVRVRELKQMIKTLHDNGISVIMDVVYNHVYKTAEFCFNRLVPMYFSRITDGKASNGSGCGNDTASERSMVRKYIIDSVHYWADEYHIDGFRFDLVGLLDVDTINAVVEEVHKNHPNVLFYGEGWSMGTDVTKNVPLATQINSKLTPDFGYFNDTVRDALRGSTFQQDTLGFVTGARGMTEVLESCFRGLPFWCCDPKQSINYVSCHDNNTFFDRIRLARPNAATSDHIRMYKLGAAFYFLSQGIPLLQAGEEMLRSKPDGKGGFVENSYRSPDTVNSLKWNLLDQADHRNVLNYYRGLIRFRKAHPVLRLTSAYEVLSHVVPLYLEHDQLVGFHINGDIPDEPAEELVVIFNAAQTPEIIALPKGEWKIQINGEKAGIETLATASGSVTVQPVSALVLIK